MNHDPLRLIKIERWARVLATYILIGGTLLVILSGFSVARVAFSPTAPGSSGINIFLTKSINALTYLQATLGMVVTFISLLAVSRLIRFLWMLKNLALRRKLAVRKKIY